MLVSTARACFAGRQSVSPRVRVRTPAGRWLVLRAVPLSGVDADIGITIEPAGPPDVVRLGSPPSGSPAASGRWRA